MSLCLRCEFPEFGIINQYLRRHGQPLFECIRHDLGMIGIPGVIQVPAVGGEPSGLPFIAGLLPAFPFGNLAF